jgi:hypothetical protein
VRRKCYANLQSLLCKINYTISYTCTLKLAPDEPLKSIVLVIYRSSLLETNHNLLGFDTSTAKVST